MTDPTGRRWPHPFTTAGDDSFFAWLAEPAAERAQPALPRVAMALWDMRADLRAHFRQPLGNDARGFLDWLRGPHGATELDSAWLASAEASLALAAPEGAAPRTRPVKHAVPPPVATRIDLPALALEIHQQRYDLQLTFPDLLGASRLPYAVWFVTHGRSEYSLAEDDVRPVLRTLPLDKRWRARLWWARRQWLARREREAREEPATAPLDEPAIELPPQPAPGPAGVNVVGWASAPTGVGEACRGTLLALDAGSIQRAVYDLAAAESAAAASIHGPAAYGLPYEVTLYHVNADMMSNIANELPQSVQLGRFRVGYWFWELAHFPLVFASAFDHVDEVWAPTRFCAEAYRTIAPCEVRLVPPCVPATVAAAADRAELGVPADAFLYYNAFDALSVPERKNPQALLAAFRRVAEEAPRPVHLLLKVSGATIGSRLAQELKSASRNLPVTLLADTWPRSRVNTLMAAADAYVSLHRSEGLGLPLIEAMYLGKPVVSTGYGGCADFLDATTGWPVPYELVPITEPHGPYPAGAVWAEPDVEAAARAMLEVVSSPAAGLRITAARRRVESLYSPAAAAARLAAELARIRGQAVLSPPVPVACAATP